MAKVTPNHRPVPASVSGSSRPRRSSKLLGAIVWLYLLAVIGVAASMLRLSDVWWPATLLIYAPRWLWALPLLLLVPAALAWRRRSLWVLAATSALLLVPVAGFVPPSPAALMAPAERHDLRVVSYNLGGGDMPAAELVLWLEELSPDIAVFQECQHPIEAASQALLQRGWKIEIRQGSCMLSRHPIRKVQAMDPKEIWKMGGSGIVVGHEIAMPDRMVHVVNLHLETVREGLNAVAYRRLDGVPELEANIEQRDIESSLARAFALQSEGPLVVAGDFNMPQESAIFRRYWGDFTNAFSASGWGFGTTKATRWHGIRIDHVLLGPGWSPVRSWTAPHLGGDHRPMVADVAWRGAR